MIKEKFLILKFTFIVRLTRLLAARLLGPECWLVNLNFQASRLEKIPVKDGIQGRIEGARDLIY